MEVFASFVVTVRRARAELPGETEAATEARAVAPAGAALAAARQREIVVDEGNGLVVQTLFDRAFDVAVEVRRTMRDAE